jgi:hypothetical protein
MDNELFREMKEAIDIASQKHSKKTEVHYQILKNAQKLEGISSEDFCKRLGLSKGYNIEFKNMMRLAKRIENQL